MSFLLDALRKSERAGRQPSAPTIHSETPVDPASERKNELLPLLGVLLPAFLIMCWFGLQQFGHGPSSTQSAASSNSDDLVAAVAVPQEDEGPGRVHPDAQPSPATAQGERDVQEQADSSRRETDDTPRTPVEQFAAAAVENTEDPGADRDAKSVVQPEATVSRPQQKIPQQEPVRNEPGAEPIPETRQNHIDYWELPGNIREQLPQFRISVLVYADQPADRFILINGQRKYEGDSLQQGLVLREIRREGAVFSYRNYRFIVAQ